MMMILEKLRRFGGVSLQNENSENSVFVHIVFFLIRMCLKIQVSLSTPNSLRI